MNQCQKNLMKMNINIAVFKIIIQKLVLSLHSFDIKSTNYCINT
jgi:hypothetical protein